MTRSSCAARRRLTCSVTACHCRSALATIQSITSCTCDSICRGTSATTSRSNSRWIRALFIRSGRRPTRSVSSKNAHSAILELLEHVVHLGQAELELPREIGAIDVELAVDVVDGGEVVAKKRHPAINRFARRLRQPQRRSRAD